MHSTRLRFPLLINRGAQIITFKYFTASTVRQSFQTKGKKEKKKVVISMAVVLHFIRNFSLLRPPEMEVKKKKKKINNPLQIIKFFSPTASSETPPWSGSVNH